MKSKIMIGLIILAFLCTSAFLMTACTQQQADMFKAGMMADDLPASGPERYSALTNLFEKENVYFNFDRSDITNKGVVVLKHKAEWLDGNTSKVQIAGHCDDRGSNAYNMALGQRRANAAKRYISGLGIDSGRISTVSYGEEKPADTGQNQNAWAKNRRCEFKAQ